jgi:UDP-arabinose 4-epimerase
MHFAAYAYVGESTAEPAKYYDNNIGGSAKLVQAGAAFDCRHVVFSLMPRTSGTLSPNAGIRHSPMRSTTPRLARLWITASRLLR